MHLENRRRVGKVISVLFEKRELFPLIHVVSTGGQVHDNDRGELPRGLQIRLSWPWIGKCPVRFPGYMSVDNLRGLSGGLYRMKSTKRARLRETNDCRRRDRLRVEMRPS